MRYGIVAFSLFGLAIASTGCSRDAVDVDFSADADRAIRFEGRCDDATRAVPGDPADGKVPVYWCDGDAVSVACAQATPSVGRYVLTCPDEFSVSASFGSGDSQQWGGGLHDFYAFSPADRCHVCVVSGEPSKGGSSFFTLRRGSGSARAAVAGEKRRCVYRTAAFFVIFG